MASPSTLEAMIYTTTEYDFLTNRFTIWDYVVFGGVLVISASIGIYYGCTGTKQKTTSEFLMADRSMSLFPVTLSLLASFMSSVGLLGIPAEVYVFGTQFGMLCLGEMICIPIAVYVFIPVFYGLGLTSVFEYLQLRFGRAVRIFGCCLFIVQMIFFISIVLYAPCLALSVVTGFNKWISLCVVGLVCTFYTTIGGMKAVMWTDVFQIFVMFSGMITVIVKGSLDHGGFGNLWKILEEGDRLEFFDLDPDPLKRHTTWALVIGGCFAWLSIYGVNQAQIQRILCCPTMKQGQIAMWLNLPGFVAVVTVCICCGAVVFAEYRFCDPIVTGRIRAGDQLLPQYVMDRLFYPGLPGLFTACIFSGALSTISSGLNSLAAVTLQDLVKGNCVKDMSEDRAIVVTKILAFSYGLLMIALSFVVSQLGAVLQVAFKLFGMVGGPLLGLFILGIIYPWTNHKGAFVGTLVSLLATLWLGIGSQIYKPGVYKPPINITGCPLVEVNVTMAPYTTIEEMYTSTTSAPPSSPEDRTGYIDLYSLSYMWYGPFAVLVTTIVGLLVSACTGLTNPRDLDPRLIHPIIYKLCCCCPKSSREKTLCGVGKDFHEEDEKISPHSDMVDTSGDLENGFTNLDLDKSQIDTSGDLENRYTNPGLDISQNTRL